MQIAIIGGGIGGLTAAIALRRRGHDVAVYERAPELREAGAGITLWPNAMRVLFDLGVGDAIASRGLRLADPTIRAANGKILGLTDTRTLERHFEAPAVALHRADLHAVLIDALPADVFHLGAACTAVTADGDRPAVHFAGGSTVQADLVIGADGIHSAVRQHLFPSIQPRYSGYTGWRGVTRHDAAAVTETWGRGARFGFVPIGHGRVYWFATQNAPAGTLRNDEENRTHLLNTFGEWHAPIRDLIATTRSGAILQHDIIDIAPFATWSRGRVVLLGDAAHPTTPNLGQGACMAIESAAVLAEELDRRDADAAIAAYVRRRAPRVRRITEESWNIGAVGQWEGRFSTALRDLAMRALPRKLAERRLMQVIGNSDLRPRVSGR